MEAYAGRGNMERRAREAQAAGRTTRLFEIMAERNRTRLASGVWEQALAEGDELARELLDEADGRHRGRRRVGASTCSTSRP